MNVVKHWFNQLSKKNVNVDIILQSVGRHGTKDITFTVPKGQKAETLEAIENIRPLIAFDDVVIKDENGTISLKDNETGAEYVIQTGCDSTSCEATKTVEPETEDDDFDVEDDTDEESEYEGIDEGKKEGIKEALTSVCALLFQISYKNATESVSDLLSR